MNILKRLALPMTLAVTLAVAPSAFGAPDKNGEDSGGQTKPDKNGGDGGETDGGGTDGGGTGGTGGGGTDGGSTDGGGTDGGGTDGGGTDGGGGTDSGGNGNGNGGGKPSSNPGTNSNNVGGINNSSDGGTFTCRVGKRKFFVSTRAQCRRYIDLAGNSTGGRSTNAADRAFDDAQAEFDAQRRVRTTQLLSVNSIRRAPAVPHTAETCRYGAVVHNQGHNGYGYGYGASYSGRVIYLPTSRAAAMQLEKRLRRQQADAADTYGDNQILTLKRAVERTSVRKSAPASTIVYGDARVSKPYDPGYTSHRRVLKKRKRCTCSDVN